MTNDAETGGACALFEQKNLIPATITKDAEALFSWMAAKEVDEIRVEYSGESDAGDFSQGYVPDMEVELPEDILKLSEALAEEAVTSRHSGWENDAGGNGTVIFIREEHDGHAVVKIQVEHADYFDDSTTDYHTVFDGDGEEDFGLGRINTVLTAMKELGIAEINVTYSGGGDSGDIDEIFCLDADGQEIDARLKVDGAIQSIIREIVTEDAWSPWYGWWNNAGGSGNVYFWMKAEDSGFPRVFCEHNDNHTEESADYYDFYVMSAAS